MMEYVDKCVESDCDEVAEERESELQSRIERINRLRRMAEELRRICGETADRVFGVEPTASGLVGGEASRPNGDFAKMDDCLSSLENALNLGLSSANRIRKI